MLLVVKDELSKISKMTKAFPSEVTRAQNDASKKYDHDHFFHTDQVFVFFSVLVGF